MKFSLLCTDFFIPSITFRNIYLQKYIIGKDIFFKKTMNKKRKDGIKGSCL